MAKENYCTCSAPIDTSDLKLQSEECNNGILSHQHIRFVPETGMAYNEHGQFIGTGKFKDGILVLTSRKFDFESQTWEDGLDVNGNELKSE